MAVLEGLSWLSRLLGTAAIFLSGYVLIRYRARQMPVAWGRWTMLILGWMMCGLAVVGFVMMWGRK